MNRYKTLSWAVLVSFAAVPAFGREQALRLLESSDKTCAFEYVPEFKKTSQLVDGKTYVTVSASDAGLSGETGEPSLPAAVAVLAVPPDGNVSVSLVSDETREESGRLLPSPGFDDNEIPGYVYSEGPVYSRTGFFPDLPYEVSNPEWFGPNRIVRITARPVQFDPSANRLRLHSKMGFRVVFDGKASAVSAMPSESDRGAFLNAEFAAGWKLPAPPKSFAKAKALGERVKIFISREGIYRITGRSLKDNGVDIGSIDPANLRLYNNGGRELPRIIATARPDSLIENPIRLVGMDDGRFDETDAIIFYGKGLTGWTFDSTMMAYSHYIHSYAKKNVYWLGWETGAPGLRITQSGGTSGSPIAVVGSFRDHVFIEQDLVNLFKGGVTWVGQELTNGRTVSFNLPLVSPMTDSIRLRIRFKGETANTHFITETLGSKTRRYSFAGTSFEAKDWRTTLDSLTSSVLTLDYDASASISKAYIDWIEADYQRPLQPRDGQLVFNGLGLGGPAAFRLSGFGATPSVFNVTNPERITSLAVNPDGADWTVLDEVAAASPKTYAAVENGEWFTPDSLKRDTPSDLRGSLNAARFVIIAPREFWAEAERLKAHKESFSRLTTAVVDIQDVYDEFGWGVEDPVAIRDFLKWAFEHWSVRPEYVLLFGDGGYDYRGLLGYPSKNWIPPFEFDGLSDAGSRSSDDWFTYVSGNDSDMDMAIGRLPVQTAAEARIVVDKIIQYEADPLFGEWRNWVTMVGDDEITPTSVNEILHTAGAEDIIENHVPAFFNFKKIYLTEYPPVQTVERVRKPQAEDALVARINTGTLIVNYVGHGNKDLWAHERAFNRSTDLPRLANGDMLPFFYAATCEFGFYDNPAEPCFSEDLVTAENRGAIAVIAASRFCSATANMELNREFMNQLFASSQPKMLGEALRLAKIKGYSVSNNEMYHVLGDPTLRLAVPRQNANFTSMEPDSLHALSPVAITGALNLPGFNGRVVLKAFDSRKKRVYFTQVGDSLTYFLPGNAVYRSEFEVSADTFRSGFVVPKDIAYGESDARLSVYFYGNGFDGSGYRNGIPVGGSASSNDADGPDITLSFSENPNFVSGGLVPANSELLAVVEDDPSGVNITGEIGHQLMLEIDGKTRIDLTDRFQYDEGSYLRGRFAYRIEGLSLGDHELTLKAWDNANNSSASALAFRVTAADEIRIESVLNYPNPMRTDTRFTFELNVPAEIDIRIFTVAGRLIRKLDGIAGEAGFNMVFWDGLDSAGDAPANGAYLYKISARARLGTKSASQSAVGRLLIMR